MGTSMARRFMHNFRRTRPSPPARPLKVEAVGSQMTLVDYDEKGVHEIKLTSIRDCFPFKEKNSITWIDITRPFEVEVMKEVAEIFQLHPLTIEDILDTDQRPKLEEFDQYVLIIVKKPVYHSEDGTIDADQVSIILTQGTVISFHSRTGMLATLRPRIEREWSRVRKFGADYLAYVLVDSIVDDYFTVMEACEEKIEQFDNLLLGEPSTAVMKGIHHFKQEMKLLRRSVWPLREVVSSMQKANSPLLDTDIKAYVKDLQGHIVHIMDVIEIMRDSLSGMLDLYLSTVSHYTNQVMKTLTMIASIFIPLTVVTGIYGMNFTYMPELEWQYGYPLCLGLMVLISIGMLIYFKRKKWF
jgi:magnesium transporter